MPGALGGKNRNTARPGLSRSRGSAGGNTHVPSAVTGWWTRSLSHHHLHVPKVMSVVMEEGRLRAPILISRNQKADMGNITSWGPVMNLRSMTTVPKMLRLPHFLTVKTWKQIAPRLLDYLQPSSCFDHLKNEQASSKEVCLQETVELLLSRCRPACCARSSSSGPFVPWDPG